MADELKARVAYLRGFSEGLELGEETKEQKVLLRIIDILDAITEELDQLKVDYEELFEYTEAIDDDLTELEEDFYEEDDEDSDDEEDDCEDYEGGFSIECPNCREIVVVDDDLLDREDSIELTCSGCGEVVLVDDEEWEEDLDELLEEEEDEEEGKDKE